jgi:two-component system LytT family sensor kinase
MNAKQESQLAALVAPGPGGASQGLMELRRFGVPLVSFWPLQFGGWGVVLMFPLLIWVTGTAVEPNLVWLAFSRPFFGLLVTTGLRPYCSRMFHRGASPYLLIPAIVIAAAVIGCAESQVAYWLLRSAGLPDLPGQIWVGMLIYRFLTLLVWLLLYFGIKSLMSHSEIVREFQRSEIRLLRSQVNPHFLFNALTTIMALRKDEAQVALITQSLADYLRFSLSQQEEGRLSHPLGQELEALENYLQVRSVRHGPCSARFCPLKKFKQTLVLLDPV